MSKGKKQAKQSQPRLPTCHFQQTIKVKFCGTCDKGGNGSTKHCYEGPAFNVDRVASTSAFILKSQKEKFKLSASILDSEKEQKHFQVMEEKSQMLIPKPSSKSFYCNVCKQKYEDYLQVQHIGSQKHRHKIKTNTFSKHILKLSAQYKKQKPFKDKEKSNTQTTLSQPENVIVIDQDSGDQGGLGATRKRVKLDGTVKSMHEQAMAHQFYFQNLYRYQQQIMMVDYFRNMQQYFNSIAPLNPAHLPLYHLPCAMTPEPHPKNRENMPRFANQTPFPMVMPSLQPSVSRRAQKPRAPANNIQFILIQDDL